MSRIPSGLLDPTEPRDPIIRWSASISLAAEAESVYGGGRHEISPGLHHLFARTAPASR